MKKGEFVFDKEKIVQNLVNAGVSQDSAELAFVHLKGSNRMCELSIKLGNKELVIVRVKPDAKTPEECAFTDIERAKLELEFTRKHIDTKLQDVQNQINLKTNALK